MAEKPTPKESAPDMVEVRLLAPFINQRMPDGTTTLRKRGDVFLVERRIYEADIEPDRGMGRPAQGRAFALVANEKAAEAKKAAAAKSTQDRIASVRASVIDQDRALDAARATARTIEAENARAIAKKVTEPLERPGARRAS